MTRTLLTAAALLLLGVSLTACFGKSSKPSAGTAVVTPPPAAAPFEAQFGGGFNTAFAVAANAEPVAITTSELVAVNATAEPVALPR